MSVFFPTTMPYWAYPFYDYYPQGGYFTPYYSAYYGPYFPGNLAYRVVELRDGRLVTPEPPSTTRLGLTGREAG